MSRIWDKSGQWPTLTSNPKTGNGLWIQFTLDDGSIFTALMDNDLLHGCVEGIEVQLVSSNGIPVTRACIIRKFIKEAVILQVVGRPDGINQDGKVPIFRRKNHGIIH